MGLYIAIPYMAAVAPTDIDPVRGFGPVALGILLALFAADAAAAALLPPTDSRATAPLPSAIHAYRDPLRHPVGKVASLHHRRVLDTSADARLRARHSASIPPLA